MSPLAAVTIYLHNSDINRFSQKFSSVDLRQKLLALEVPSPKSTYRL